jgi:hypothetical protein
MIPEEILLVQEHLNSLGERLDIDGRLGRATRQAAQAHYATRGNSVVAALQSALNARGAKLNVDGVYGPKTRAAFLDHAPGLSKSWFTLAQLMPHLREAGILFHHRQEHMTQLLKMEARQLDSAKGTLFSATGISATNKHRGLLQLSQAAWSDAQRHAAERGISLEPYSSWADPRQSILAGGSYMEWAYNLAVKKYGKLPPTFEVKYSLYNQGPGFGKKLKDPAFYVLGNQSGKANRVFLTAQKQVHNLIG